MYTRIKVLFYFLYINAVMIDSNFATFVSVEIINLFNLSEKANNKESIVDLKAVTEDRTIVIIEIQTYSTKNFFERTLYYWSKNYSSVLKKGEDYPELGRLWRAPKQSTLYRLPRYRSQ